MSAEEFSSAWDSFNDATCWAVPHDSNLQVAALLGFPNVPGTFCCEACMEAFVSVSSLRFRSGGAHEAETGRQVWLRGTMLSRCLGFLPARRPRTCTPAGERGFVVWVNRMLECVPAVLASLLLPNRTLLPGEEYGLSC